MRRSRRYLLWALAFAAVGLAGWVIAWATRGGGG